MNEERLAAYLDWIDAETEWLDTPDGLTDNNNTQ